MTESEFANWALDLGIDGTSLRSLIEVASHHDKDTFVGRSVEDFAGIKELSEEEPLGVLATNGGFLVFGSCPNGDQIAVDLKTDPGSVHYLFFEEEDELKIISNKIVPNLPMFVTMMNAEKLPFDYHEAIGWQCPTESTG